MGKNSNFGIFEAKRTLANILAREWLSRGTAPEEYLAILKRKYRPDSQISMSMLEDAYFINKNAPEIMAVGTNQLVMCLSEGFVGKTSLHDEREGTLDHHVLSHGIYHNISSESVETLRELGFEIPLHHYVDIERQNDNFFVRDGGHDFLIADDLTEGGKYIVEDVSEQHFKNLVNGKEIRKELITKLKKLNDIYRKKIPPYVVEVNSHVTTQGPNLAFQHMFFVQIDKVINSGRLVIGDLDHVVFYKR